MEDKRYSIELEVITPLSVGAGNDKEWVKGLDFVQKDGKVYVLDLQKAVAQGVDVGRLTDLFLRYDDGGIIQLLGNQLEKVSSHVFDSPMRTDNRIKTFLRTQFYDKPVVAGSSLKGSIRSALFKFLRTTEEKNEEVFGTMKDGTDFMRFIRVGDIEMPSTILVNSKIFNLRGSGNRWQGGWKHGNTNWEGDSHTTGSYSPVGFNTLFECVEPGQKGFGTISLAGRAFELMELFSNASVSYSGKKRALLSSPVVELFKVINEVTKSYLKKERSFFEKYPAERTDELLANIDRLLNMIPADGSSCLLKMSAGVGFHSITGDWQFDDYDDTDFWTDKRNAGKKKYKSRKTAEYKGRLNLMGFVRLRALSAAEAEAYEQRLQQEHEAIKAQLAAPIREREEARLRQAEADAERARAAAEEAQKREDYDALIQQARQLFKDKKWKEAIAKAEEAAALLPGTEYKTIIDDCKREQIIEEAQTIINGGTEALLSQTLAEALAGKTSVGNLVGTLAKWLKGENNAFTDTEQVAFLSAVKKLPEKERKKLSSKRKDLVKVIGEEATTKFFVELGL